MPPVKPTHSACSRHPPPPRQGDSDKSEQEDRATSGSVKLPDLVAASRRAMPRVKSARSMSGFIQVGRGLKCDWGGRMYSYNYVITGVILYLFCHIMRKRCKVVVGGDADEGSRPPSRQPRGVRHVGERRCGGDGGAQPCQILTGPSSIEVLTVSKCYLKACNIGGPLTWGRE